MTTSENKPQTKICESCSEQFGCGAQLEGCWCVEVPLKDDVAADLRSKYKDCLCPNCLNSLAIHPSIVVTYPNGATETILGAIRVDTENFHEGMLDFYDGRGVLLKQISMSANIDWK